MLKHQNHYLVLLRNTWNEHPFTSHLMMFTDEIWSVLTGGNTLQGALASHVHWWLGQSHLVKSKGGKVANWSPMISCKWANMNWKRDIHGTFIIHNSIFHSSRNGGLSMTTMTDRLILWGDSLPDPARPLDLFLSTPVLRDDNQVFTWHIPSRHIQWKTGNRSSNRFDCVETPLK